VSPAMKNAYDWLSYSPDLEHPSPVRNLPAALISVGAGEDGQNVQKHFLQMAQFCRLRVMAKPNLHFSTKSKNLYNEKLELTETANEELYKFLEYFSDFIGKKRKNQ
jgi:NAD(P)H-dependent FMN reductase